ncbi:hypothetical protein B0H11DRAFT_1926076 [Mycena galericulata]|nr:hypothetical protein B0H11DRAFT_1926076 [Mycena galericulata]
MLFNTHLCGWDSSPNSCQSECEIVSFSTRRNKQQRYWNHIDAELAERRAKALTIEAALRPAFSSYIFEEALKSHLQLCRPSKKRKSSQQLPKWQQDISRAIAEMEAYTVEQLAEEEEQQQQDEQDEPEETDLDYLVLDTDNGRTLSEGVADLTSPALDVRRIGVLLSSGSRPQIHVGDKAVTSKLLAHPYSSIAIQQANSPSVDVHMVRTEIFHFGKVSKSL